MAVPRRDGRGFASRQTPNARPRAARYEQFLQTRPLPAAMACWMEPDLMLCERLSDGQSGVVWYTLPPDTQ